MMAVSQLEKKAFKAQRKDPNQVVTTERSKINIFLKLRWNRSNRVIKAQVTTMVYTQIRNKMKKPSALLQKNLKINYK